MAPIWEPDAAAPLDSSFRAAIAQILSDFLGTRKEQLRGLGPELESFAAVAGRLLVSGKRLRPAFAVWSYLAAAGARAKLPAVLTVAASLELLHTGILLHDDIIDASDSRRGGPAAHRALASLHQQQGMTGDSDAFGRNAAILLGDLLQLWSVDLADTGGELGRASKIAEVMRTEVLAGQFLDLVAESQPWPTTAQATDLLALARRVVAYKSARYTIIRPCQLGASLAGAPDSVIAGLTAFAEPLGQAFQFRDDLLGVFGDTTVTGKPVGDDLRQGKRTVLVGYAWERTDTAGRQQLAAGIGKPDLDPAALDQLCDLLRDCGAKAAVESEIEHLTDSALSALERLDLEPQPKSALARLAELAVRRTT